MGSFRTAKTQSLYDERRQNGHLSGACVLCSETPLKQFTYWKLIENKFPYDRISKTHHMIVPVRHIVETELSDEEKDELLSLKRTYLNERYRYIFESLPRLKSIPEHFHMHVIVPKDDI